MFQAEVYPMLPHLDYLAKLTQAQAVVDSDYLQAVLAIGGVGLSQKQWAELLAEIIRREAKRLEKEKRHR